MSDTTITPTETAPDRPGGATTELSDDRGVDAPADDAAPPLVDGGTPTSGRSLRRFVPSLRSIIAPVIGVTVFLLLWAAIAPQIDTRLGSVPGPAEVAEAGQGLFDEWQAARQDRADFFEAQDLRNAALVEAGRGGEVQNFEYAGTPTFVDQVWTSLRTVGFGFLIGTLIAIPLGLLSGLSPTFRAAINPLVQVMKPISPLAWLPIVTIVVSATVTSDSPILAQSFIVSALVVTLCSLWPTLINTAVGASSVDKDLLNVGKVLRLNKRQQLSKLIIPSSLPYMFTGMRLSLGVGWMVLIAAEMLAQNPGLGKFVWDEFQNGSSQSLARIMFAVVVIGIIGFALDRLMSAVEKFVSRNRVV